MKTGLTSITFRKKSVDEIISMCKKAELDGIEWGSDVHVVAGDLNLAKEVYQKMVNAGLSVLSYGSYFKGENIEDFDAVLASAKALKAPIIRIWAGRRIQPETVSQEEFDRLVHVIRQAADLAQKEGILLALEYHRNTLTQSKEGALRLLKALNHNQMRCYWQPNPDIDLNEQVAEISILSPYLCQFHVFHWNKDERLLLNEGKKEWIQYIETAKKYNLNPTLILEFVKDDLDENFYEDAKTLLEIKALFE